jgi:hypothetical protein
MPDSAGHDKHNPSMGDRPTTPPSEAERDPGPSEGTDVRPGREPPGWVPQVVLVIVPLMIAGMALGGRFSPRGALACLLVGVFLLLLLIGWWSASSSLRGFLGIAVVSVACACALTAALAWLSHAVGATPAVATPEQAKPSSRLDMTNAHLDGGNLSGVHLEGAFLNGVSAVSATMIGADLKGAHLLGAVLKGAIMTGACLQDADLRGADLHGTVFVGADLRQAKFDPGAKADLPSSAEQVSSRACG